jgi:Holliday junction resolvasome RuvABC endonuclease subunit
MTKLVWDINKVENRFKIALRRNSDALGLDTASKTGYCIAKTDSKKLVLNVGFIDVDVSKVKDKYERNQIRYNVICEAFMNLIDSKLEAIVVEDVYYSGNPLTLILLARIGAIAFTLAKVKKLNRIIWKSAVQARKLLGLKCNAKKELVQKQFCKMLDTTLQNEDVVDAIILALVGLMEE